MSSPVQNNEPLDAENDALLQLSRRIDWRFLFPTVELNEVFYIGRGDEGLIQALRAFSDQLTLNSEQASLDKKYDWLVMQNPSLNSFRKALPRLKVRGRFYLEFERSGSKATLQRLQVPNAFMGVAHQAGFTGLESNWHWPSFVEANRIIPLQSFEGIAFVMSKGRQDTRTKIMLTGMSLLLQSSLLHRLISCVSVIGYRDSI